MKLRHLLLSALMLSAGTAWADVTINETNFPDENFRSYLLSQDYGSDGVLTDAEIEGVTSMSVFNKNIQNLKGIEYFTALEYLYCYDNQLTSLDVSKNTALTDLSCYGNQLTSLDVSGCTALEYLLCYDNQLTSLDVSKNTKLEWLWCYSNALTSLDVSKNTALTWLSCDRNQLTSLDVSGCTVLTTLYCYENKINGEAMDAFIESLPTVGYGYMYVRYYENEQNEMTTTQVAAATAKGWTPIYTEDGTTWEVYAGVDPATAISGVDADETADSAPWYTISGVLLTEKPTQPGIYIHGGKKVLVK